MGDSAGPRPEGRLVDHTFTTHCLRGNLLKHLKITYGDVTIWDAPVDEFGWQETGSGVSVQGKVSPRSGRRNQSAVSDLLQAALASKRTQNEAAALEEPVAVEG